jgi:hypothetical protein
MLNRTSKPTPFPTGKMLRNIDSRLVELQGRLRRISTETRHSELRKSLKDASRSINTLLGGGSQEQKKVVLRAGRLLLKSVKLAEAERATAFHEAGHAVAAFAFGIPILRKGITVIPGDGYDGQCHHSGSIGGDPNTNRSEAMKSKAERQSIVALAGMQAQRRYRRYSVRRYHGHNDYLRAANLLSHFTESREEEGVWLRLLQIRAERLVEIWWPTIERLADVLVEKQTLTGKQVEQLIRDALVDRRPV